MKQKLSFCRMCMGHCGVVATVDDEDRLVAIRGDHEDPQTMGYACFKGMKAVEAHYSAHRVLQPLKRQADGSFTAVPMEQALDEIAARIRALLERHGPEAVGGYKGGGGFFTSSSVMMLHGLLTAMGSPKSFSSVTIDQSSKMVALGRIGIWPAGRDPFGHGDVCLLVGANPLVSVSTNTFDNRNPTKRLKAAKARGMKLIVIDPRRSETAKFADVFLQPLPGEDVSVLAGLLHLVLVNGWQDESFCAAHAAQIPELRAAVAPFTPDYVAERSGISTGSLIDAARLFASESRRGAATSATGPDMSPWPNLAEHLIEALNVVCGRFIREGEEIPNPGVIMPRFPRQARVVPAPRWWEHGYRSRIGGYGHLDGELPTGILADEILTPGAGQIRCLLVHGGNPASAVPDQRKIVQALQSLELLVSIEPFMTETARLSHYILPPTLPYERADLPLFIYENLVTPEPYTRYTPAVARPPAGADVRDDHYYFWSLARRLGLRLEYFGHPLDMDAAPDTDDLLALAARHAPLDFDEIKAAPRGIYVDAPQRVEPAEPAPEARFSLMPDDVAAELREAFAQAPVAGFPYRLAVRRHRDVLNSACRALPSVRERVPFNLAYMNPADLVREGCSPGDMVEIASGHGAIRARAAADPELRCGVVSISHGFGALPGETDYAAHGVSTNLLISTDSDRASINAMPRMSGIPVRVTRA